MKPTDYLRERNIVPKDKTDLIISFDDGIEVSLIELMESYHQEKLKLFADWLDGEGFPIPDRKLKEHINILKNRLMQK